ncbi:prepilin peptidase [Shewanella sp. Choline-02u-19]|uniref:A24 family peptidase n=1 Tax=unclassified Shewanella TaxID=196818 RepID=UPI000C348016|nr:MULTISPECIES: A24 family peptidase [unclassified Shewanella]PKH62879.1 prepilin peptidase [Shewanella sp. Bg11-22]PKI27616.1 prepilin peptidase [Shewanella sp. Choline-02u-19]
MNDIQIIVQVVLTSVFFIMAISIDLLKEKIPNKLCLMAIFCGFVVNSYFAHFNGLLLSFVGFSLAFIILFPTFLMRVLGAGDIKLMMGIGALIGPSLLVSSIVYALFAGAFTSILLVLWKTGLSGLLKTVRRYWYCFYLRTYFKPDGDEAAGQKVPYAPALALGWIWACSADPHIYGLYSSFSHYIS